MEISIEVIVDYVRRHAEYIQLNETNNKKKILNNEEYLYYW